jgi:2-polyprenyl-3-methyl-5-hydroxy-6-metoxy-1,4-benzoquinol methylase
MEKITEHYLTDEIDPLFLRGSRDCVSRYIKTGNILNVGLGYGVWDEMLATCESHVVGLDNNSELVSHFSKKYPSIQYVISDVYAYRPRVRFDTIIASHFLEHVSRPGELLKLFASWLAPEGRILIIVPNAESIHRRIGVQMGILKGVADLSESDTKLGHLRVYSEESLREEIEKSGLQVQEIGGTTFKALSNAQLAAFPRSYVEACAKLGKETGRSAAQIFAVATN